MRLHVRDQKYQSIGLARHHHTAGAHFEVAGTVVFDECALLHKVLAPDTDNTSDQYISPSKNKKRSYLLLITNT
jgi:hypothetical protein